MTPFPTAKGSPSGLSGLALSVWRLADGQTPISRIAARLACPAEQVWTALDLLDHVGLVTPHIPAEAAARQG